MTPTRLSARWATRRATSSVPGSDGEATRPSSRLSDVRRGPEMARRKRRSNNPAGRPSRGLSEAAVLVRMPREQLDATDAAAEAEGVSRTEWIRRAVAARLTAPVASTP